MPCTVSWHDSLVCQEPFWPLWPNLARWFFPGSAFLRFLRSLVGISIKYEVTERHRRIHDQGGMMRCGLVLPHMPIAHLVTEAGQSADNADESSESLFQVVADLRVFR